MRRITTHNPEEFLIGDTQSQGPARSVRARGGEKIFSCTHLGVAL
jgi:hypothetical protein